MILQRNEMKCNAMAKQNIYRGIFHVIFKQVVMWVPVKTGYLRNGMIFTPNQN